VAEPSVRRFDLLTALAVATTAFHLLALALAGASIAPGTMDPDPTTRAAYLAGRPAGWTVGWMLWMASAITLVAFLAVVAERWPSPLTRLAVVFSAAAAAVDLSADTLQITMRPALAAAGPTPAFIAAEIALDCVGFVAANGIYSCAVLLASLGLPPEGRLTRVLGVATFLAGMTLAAAGFTLNPRHLQVTAGATMVCFVGWALAVTRVRPLER
jgi:hypothetical protein